MGDVAAVEHASVVTIGTYDGVHLGHRMLIAETIRRSRELGAISVVVTFDQHPASVLRPGSAPKLLTTLEHRLELLRATGVDDIVVLHFDAARAAETAEDFVERVLVAELRARAVVVGSTFRFGHDTMGDLSLLESMGATHGFVAVGLELVTDDAERSVVSSSRIRALLRRGEIETAARLLGRDHEVRGVAVELAGDAEGALGVVVPGQLALPPAGSYWAQVGPPVAPERPALVELTEADAASGEGVLVLRPRPDDRNLDHARWPATGSPCAVRFVAPYLAAGRGTP